MDSVKQITEIVSNSPLLTLFVLIGILLVAIAILVITPLIRKQLKTTLEITQAIQEINKAVNGKEIGQPTLQADVLTTVKNTESNSADLAEIKGNISNLSSRIDDVVSALNSIVVKFDGHLSWHQQERQAKPRCDSGGSCAAKKATACKTPTTKAVVKKAPVKRVATKRVAS